MLENGIEKILKINTNMKIPIKIDSTSNCQNIIPII